MGRGRRAAAVAAIAAALSLGPAVGASARPAETSGVFLTVQDDAVEVELQIPIDRLALATGLDLAYTDDLDVALASILANADELDEYVLDNLALADEDGALSISLRDLSAAIVNDAPTLVVEAVAVAADGSVDGDLALDYSVVIATVAAHDVYVALVGDDGDEASGAGSSDAAGEPEVVAVLSYGATTTVVSRATASWWASGADMVAVGVSHIAEGTDHLLFLVTLLLAAPVLAVRGERGWRWAGPRPPGGTLRRIALVVSAFTLGHTASLALVSFGVVTLPTTPVELLVATSILVAAAHAVRPFAARGEIVVAAVFGLVHGTAFATTILELQLSTASTLGAVIGFNIGVELAQAIAVALVLPPLMVLARTRLYPALRLGLAAVAAAAATGWIVGLLTGSDSVFTPLFAAVAARPWPAYGLLLCIAVLAWVRAPIGTGADLEGGGLRALP